MPIVTAAAESVRGGERCDFATERRRSSTLHPGGIAHDVQTFFFRPVVVVDLGNPPAELGSKTMRDVQESRHLGRRTQAMADTNCIR